MHKYTFTALLFLLALILPANAQNKNSDTGAQAVESLNAYAAYKSGDYAKAFELWSTLAETGNTSAMNNLANMHAQGQGLEQDYHKAFEWLEKAAHAGDSVGQLNLGLAYERGQGIERNNHNAAHWFQKSAEQGDRDAQFNLGVMLATSYGKGFEQSSKNERAEASKWLQAALDSGHPDAQQMLKLLESVSN